MNSTMTDLVAAVRRLAPRDAPTPTPATVANQAVMALVGTGRDIVLEELAGEPAVLTNDEWERAKSCQTEGRLVKNLTPKFKEIFETNGACVINSEDFAWLETCGASQKPDMFISSLWCYERRLPGPTNVWKADKGFRFGVISDRRLYDTVHLLDAKCTCTNSALGELIIHCQHLSPHHHAIVRGMLFGHTEFWLIECQGNELVYRKKGVWTRAGSKNHLVKHFPAPVWQGLEGVCSDLGAELSDPALHGSSPLLGIGGFGRVVKVLKSDTIMALKVVKIEHHNVLAAEHSLLASHSNNCTCSLLARPESIVVESGKLCGYLLTPVGKHCLSRDMVMNSTPSALLVLRALLGLHQHNPPIIHGDPRLSNLIVSSGPEESLFWVDMMCSSHVALEPSDLGIHFETDLKLLLTSMVPSSDTVDLSELQLGINSYSEGPSESVIEEIALQFTIIYIGKSTVNK